MNGREDVNEVTRFNNRYKMFLNLKGLNKQARPWNQQENKFAVVLVQGFPFYLFLSKEE